MVNVTICSAFRNASAYITRYRLQVCRLAYALAQRGDWLHVVWCEGDSTDDSLARLLDAYERDGKTCGYTADIFHFHHGGPDHGSVVDAQRFRQLAAVWSRIWARIPADAAAVLFVEADLIWQTETLLALIDQLADVPAIAPMVMLQRQGYAEGTFYDVWAFRMDGQHFTNEPPYLPRRTRPDLIEGNLIRLDSAGSLVAMRAEYARQSQWRADDLIVGICKQIYEHGGSLWIDPNLSVLHL